MTRRRSGTSWLCVWAVAALGLTLSSSGLSRADDQDMGSSNGALERLQPHENSVLKSPSRYTDWNVWLAAPPPLARRHAAMMSGGTGEEELAVAPFMMWLYAGAGFALGVLCLFVLDRVRHRGSSGKRRRSAGKSTGIALISSEVLTDNGSVIVVDVMGERLVLGVSGNRDYVTLLTKLGEFDGPPSSEETRAFGNVLSAQQAAPNGPHELMNVSRAGGLGSSSTSSPGDLPAPDEDLEELLDELLGKVRGLKPLDKRADDS